MVKKIYLSISLRSLTYLPLFFLTNSTANATCIIQNIQLIGYFTRYPRELSSFSQLLLILLLSFRSALEHDFMNAVLLRDMLKSYWSIKSDNETVAAAVAVAAAAGSTVQ